jgi:hypothetical protein
MTPPAAAPRGRLTRSKLRDRLTSEPCPEYRVWRKRAPANDLEAFAKHGSLIGGCGAVSILTDPDQSDTDGSIRTGYSDGSD